jgi:hypothetical protein
MHVQDRFDRPSTGETGGGFETFGREVERGVLRGAEDGGWWWRMEGTSKYHNNGESSREQQQTNLRAWLGFQDSES